MHTEYKLIYRPHRLGAIIASPAAEIDDTRMTVGGEAMQEASQVYTHLKTAAKTTPGFEPVALQLDERFRQAKKKRSPMRWRSKAPGIGRNRVRRFNNEPPNLDTQVQNWNNED
uniref:Uncharacterized protein n=1 Tax=Candidatus Kentrum sp. LFY TaxID=2126342 RepID=A0A450V997_9GAMM|nr:MAG: hypothetical protein BECKLFY1418A_GA0070994_11451 [Candidatus Kentron sp. LFY]